MFCGVFSVWLLYELLCLELLIWNYLLSYCTLLISVDWHCSSYSVITAPHLMCFLLLKAELVNHIGSLLTNVYLQHFENAAWGKHEKFQRWASVGTLQNTMMRNDTINAISVLNYGRILGGKKKIIRMGIISEQHATVIPDRSIFKRKSRKFQQPILKWESALGKRW